MNFIRGVTRDNSMFGLLNKPVSPVQKFLFNRPKQICNYSIEVACCVHRGIDPIADQRINMLRNCVDPKVYVKIKAGDALIDRSRSIVATYFLEENHDVLMFVDDDIVFNPVDAIGICRAVKEMDLGIVAGAYMVKNLDNPFFVFRPLDNAPIRFGEGGELYEVEYASTGFMAINKKVIQRLSRDLPLCHPDELKFYPFFQPFPKKMKDGKYVYLSEDWAFCDRAREAGFKVYIDTRVKLKHAGRYEYDWDDFFINRKQDKKTFIYEDPLNPTKFNPPKL